ncbi:MAG TPA: hypothetical protein VIZ65_08530 [Cellvibrionaceae bacterium]
MKIVSLQLARWAESLSLTFFVIYIHSQTLPAGEAWLLPYLLACIIGVAVSVLLVCQHMVLNRLFLGINLYFLSGVLALALQIQQLNQLYAQLGAAAMLTWILLVGIAATLIAPVGVLGIPEARSRIHSWYLLVACVFAILWAIYFKTNTALGEWLPFIVIFTLRNYLCAAATKYTDLNP